MGLFKTRIIIWTEEDPAEMDLDVLAEAAMYGDAHCSSIESVLVKNPPEDEDWNDSEEFFGDFVNDEVEEEEVEPEEPEDYEESFR